MSHIDVTFEVVTPAYAGTADITQTEGLRPPTLKALLRFWWRTLKADSSPQRLFEEEEQIFGSTSKGQGLRVVPKGPWKQWTSDPAGTLEKDFLHVYMAYGPVAWDKASTADPARAERGKKGASVVKTPRNHVGQSRAFRLCLVNNAHVNDVRHALWMLSAFGGFGSRSRRGWGSLRVITDWGSLPDPHEGVDGARSTLGEGLGSILGPRSAITVTGGATEPEYAAFSPGSSIFVGGKCASWKRALEAAKDVFYDYRRQLGAEFGHAAGAVGPDHQKRAGWLTSAPTSADTTPWGSAFGLPHNAQFSPPGTGAKVDVGVGADLSGRRASPVFIKVIGHGGQFAPVILWLPSVFLPSSHTVHVSINGGKATSEVTYAGDDAIQEFLRGGAAAGTTWPGLAAKGWQEVTW